MLFHVRQVYVSKVVLLDIRRMIEITYDKLLLRLQTNWSQITHVFM